MSRLILLGMLCACLLTGSVRAEAPPYMPVQGVLLDPLGTQLTLMRDRDIEDRKEGFSLRSVQIVRPAATLIPYIRETTTVIGGLGIIGTVIPCTAQDFCIAVYMV